MAQVAAAEATETAVREIAIYGKGSCGKSTVATNIAYCFQQMGQKVMLVGCSPKSDSTVFLLGGRIPTRNILDYSRSTPITDANIQEIIYEGARGIKCVEAGGPAPAEGCAGRGVALALDVLKRLKVYRKLGITMVIYDVIADVVCGGFSQPMRGGYAREVYLVSSGELMAVYSANNICAAIADLAQSGVDVGVGGIIVNERGVARERDLMTEFGERIGVPIIGFIPRSPLVQQAERLGGTVVEKLPRSPQAQCYYDVANAIAARTPEDVAIPTPITLPEIMGLLRKYQALD
ncbi:MAG: hypothetical protein D9V47_08920 [Clostridia bacterium]|nr:MAG: hypothetical protein D9V47_08920 [Clostridia bacterium]